MILCWEELHCYRFCDNAYLYYNIHWKWMFVKYVGFLRGLQTKSIARTEIISWFLAITLFKGEHL